MYAQADTQRLLPKPRPMLPPNKMQSAKQPGVKIARPVSAMPASHAEMARARQINQTYPNETLYTPRAAHAAHQLYEKNASPLVKLGDHAENWLQLKQIGQQAAAMFDPRTRSGVGNIAGLFAGGPEGFSEGDASAGFEANMPGQFEQYSLAKAANGGHLSSDQMLQSVAHDAWTARNHPNADVRMAALQRLHDHLFGGEVHAKGDIPTRPNEQTMETLNANRAKVREQIRQERLDAFNKRAAERQQRPSYDAAAQHQEAMSNFLRENGIHPRMDNGSDLLWDHMGRGPHHPDFAGEHPFPGRMNEVRAAGRAGPPRPEEVIAQRQAALERFYRQQAHNHRN